MRRITKPEPAKSAGQARRYAARVTDRETRRLSFGSVAIDYDRYRPGPPPQALDWLIPPGARAVLDLAAGTGAVTRELAGRAGRIIAVEPGERKGAVLAARRPRGRGPGSRGPGRRGRGHPAARRVGGRGGDLLRLALAGSRTGRPRD